MCEHVLWYAFSGRLAASIEMENYVECYYALLQCRRRNTNSFHLVLHQTTKSSVAANEEISSYLIWNYSIEANHEPILL